MTNLFLSTSEHHGRTRGVGAVGRRVLLVGFRFHNVSSGGGGVDRVGGNVRRKGSKRTWWSRRYSESMRVRCDASEEGGTG